MILIRKQEKRCCTPDGSNTIGADQETNMPVSNVFSPGLALIKEIEKEYSASRYHEKNTESLDNTGFVSNTQQRPAENGTHRYRYKYRYSGIDIEEPYLLSENF